MIILFSVLFCKLTSWLFWLNLGVICQYTVLLITLFLSQLGNTVKITFFLLLVNFTLRDKGYWKDRKQDRVIFLIRNEYIHTIFTLFWFYYWKLIRSIIHLNPDWKTFCARINICYKYYSCLHIIWNLKLIN